MLRDLVREVSDGPGATVLIGGESGVGKSRLIDEVAREAVAGGWLCATGRAFEVENGCMFAVFADALTPMCARMDPRVVALATRGMERELSLVVPALAPAGTTRVPEADGGGKTQLFWHLAAFLRQLTERQPLLLVLENLHWADPSSLELLHSLGRASPRRVLLLGTYPDEELDASPELRRTIHALTRHERCRSMRVSPLPPDDVQALVRQLFDAAGPAPEQFARRLHVQGGGNPFFTGEILASLVESGALRQVEGRWFGWDSDAATLSATGRALVRARVESLSPAARRLAELMSAIGAPVQLGVLQQIAGDAPAALASSLEELERRGMVVAPRGDRQLHYAFTHAIVRRVVYDALGPARAQAFHAQIVTGLEAYYGAEADAHAAELAPHLAHAAERFPAERSVRCLVTAGTTALAQRADVESDRFFSAALAVVERAGGALAHARLPAILMGLARARERRGDHASATTVLLRARELARASADLAAEGAIERRLGLVAFFSGDPERAVVHLAAAETQATLGGANDLATRSRLARAIALQSSGRSAEALALILAMLPAAESRGDPALLARLHRAILLLYSWTGPASAGRRHGEIALRCAVAAGDDRLTWSVHWALALMAGLSGDGAQVDAQLRSADRLADSLGSPLMLVQGAEIGVEFASATGRWDEGLALAERVIPIARAIAPRTVLPRLLVWSAIMRIERDEMARAWDQCHEAWELSGAEGAATERVDAHVVIPACIGIATYHLRAGDFGQAAAFAERGLAFADRLGVTMWAIHRLLPVLCEAHIWLRDFDKAAAFAERLRLESGALEHPLGLAYAEATEALLQRFRDERRDAHVRLIAAADHLSAVPFLFPAARLRLNAAQLLTDDGRPEAAVRELRIAEDVFARMGAVRELRIVREQLRLVGARPRVPSDLPVAGGGLTDREREIVARVVSGKANKEIASELRLSKRTVDSHLRRVFVKLGVGSRAALVAVVVGDGVDPASSGY